MNNEPRILDTTLRDGSYAINFQFTAADTEIICSELEKAGFDLIEVGHGVGLHASESGHGEAVETDEGYLKAAAKAVKKAKFGMFCIPGVARLEDLDMAADLGMGFVRVGTNVTEVESSKEFIAKAKKYGMFVASNFMKSYAMEPAYVAERAKMSQDFGSDIVYIVDSSGGMFPDDIDGYFESIQSKCDIPLGFHAHNNLDMAIANSLRAVELGAAIVDSSLQGLGRSAGNASTEILLVALQRRGMLRDIDAIQVMDIGEKYIRPLIRSKGYSSLDIVAGESQFHSSYMSIIRKTSARHGVDPRELIRKVCAIDKVNVTQETAEKAAVELKEESSQVFTARFHFEDYYGHEESSR